MKNKILIFIIIILLPIAVISFFKKETNFNLPKNINDKKLNHYNIKIKLPDDTIETLDLEQYVIGVVAGEMPASFELEALKAQAVAARTYAIAKMQNNNNFDVYITTADQVYITKEQMQEKWSDDYSNYYNKIKDAVESTNNLVIKYDNSPIKAYYFAMSNGYTEDAVNVFNETSNYLTSVESKDDLKISNNVVTISVSKQEFCEKLQISCNSINISNIDRNSTNRINMITINNKAFSGVEIRKLLSLRSTDFTIDILDSQIEITTKGYGHGVGMSQYGANQMAKQGSDYQQIIHHYYNNVEITSI